MRIPTKCIPKRIFYQYNLQDIVNDSVNVEIRKGIYGLHQAASNALVQYLKENGYHQSDHIPGLFVQIDFGVHYTDPVHA